MNIDFEFNYPNIIELVFAIPFEKIQVPVTLIFAQIDAHSCIVSFRFGPGDSSTGWPKDIRAASLKLTTRYDARSAHGQQARKHRKFIRREEGKRPPEICIVPSELFRAVALYLANNRVSTCPVELDVTFNDEQP